MFFIGEKGEAVPSPSGLFSSQRKTKQHINVPKINYIRGLPNVPQKLTYSITLWLVCYLVSGFHSGNSSVFFHRLNQLGALKTGSGYHVVLAFPLKATKKLGEILEFTEKIKLKSHVVNIVFTCRFSSRANTLFDWFTSFLFCSRISFSCVFTDIWNTAMLARPRAV